MTTVLNLSEGRQGDILARLITSVTARLLSVDSSLVEWMRPSLPSLDQPLNALAPQGCGATASMAEFFTGETMMNLE